MIAQIHGNRHRPDLLHHQIPNPPQIGECGQLGSDITPLARSEWGQTLQDVSHSTAKIVAAAQQSQQMIFDRG